MLAMTGSFTPPQTHGVKARRFEVEDFAGIERKLGRSRPAAAGFALNQPRSRWSRRPRFEACPDTGYRVFKHLASFLLPRSFHYSSQKHQSEAKLNDAI